MNEGTLRRRITRILKTPEEILYAVTRHWMLLIIFICAGTLIMWNQVVKSPKIYQGRAQLLVNPIDTFVVSETPNRNPPGRSGDEIQRFLVSQTNILCSESVLYKLVKMVGVESAQVSEESLDLIQSLKEKLSDFFYGEDKSIPAPGQENETQNAVAGFRKRSQVKPDLGGNTITLLVYGTERNLIQKELSCWINAYVKHVEEMAKDTLESYLSERIQFYRQIETTALKELETFKKENPDVSSMSQDFLSQEIVRLQFYRDDLQRQIALGVAPHAAPLQGPLDSDAALRSKYEQELIDLLSKGFNEQSDQVQQVRKKINLLEAKKTNKEPEKATPDEEQKAERRFEKITGDLEDLMKKNAKMKEKIKVLAGLEDNYKQVREKRTKYEQITQESRDAIESRKSVQIQVADKPIVSTEPFQYRPLYKLLQGFLGGAGAGFVLALMIEIFRGRVRFMNDIVSDVGLPVIAVVPKR